MTRLRGPEAIRRLVEKGLMGEVMTLYLAGHARAILRAMIEDDPEIEESPLSGIVTREGLSVRVEIHRLVEGDRSWTLEVVDPEVLPQFGMIASLPTRKPTPSFIGRCRLKAFGRF